MTFRILVVCEGNICRSPLAERLLELRLAQEGVTDVEVSSAGTRAVVGSPIHPLAAAELTRLGGDPSGFRAGQLTDDQIAAAGLVLAATRDLRRQVLERDPSALRTTFTILELSWLLDPLGRITGGGYDELVAQAAAGRPLPAGTTEDVPDPVGGSAGLHQRVATQLDEAVRRIAGAFGQDQPG